jgi:hypothetical protein
VFSQDTWLAATWLLLIHVISSGAKVKTLPRNPACINETKSSGVTLSLADVEIGDTPHGVDYFGGTDESSLPVKGSGMQERILVDVGGWDHSDCSGIVNILKHVGSNVGGIRRTNFLHEGVHT